MGAANANLLAPPFSRAGRAGLRARAFGRREEYQQHQFVRHIEEAMFELSFDEDQAAGGHVALFRAGRNFELLPLSSMTHMTPDPVVTERLYSRIAGFFQIHLGKPTERN